VKQNETRIAMLETQNQTLMNMMKKNANEKVKITQSLAQVRRRTNITELLTHATSVIAIPSQKTTAE
jgi:hypothetical protein